MWLAEEKNEYCFLENAKVPFGNEAKMNWLKMPVEMF